MLGKRKIAMVLSEFFGVIALTTALLAVGKSGVGYSYFLAGGVALTAAAFAMAVGGISGAHFNPAVSLGLWVTRRISTVKAAVYLVAQFLGGFTAWKLYEYLTEQPLTASAAAFDWRVLSAEAIGGFIIVFVISAAVFSGYKGIKQAATIGGAIFAGALIASLGSNGLANPAIALGVQSWNAAYAVGPLIGGVVGAVLFAFVFAARTPVLVTTNGQVPVVATKSATSANKKAPTKKSTVKKAATTRKKKA